VTTFPPQHSEAARTAAAVEAFYTKPLPVEVYFSADADPAFVGAKVLELATTAGVLVRLMTAPLSVVTS